MNNKFITIEILNNGGEYTCGSVTDKEKQKKILEFIKDEKLTAYNIDEDINSYDFDDLAHYFGPAYDNSKINICIYDNNRDKNLEKEINLNYKELNSFTMRVPNIDNDFLKKLNNKDLILGAHVIEKNIQFPVEFELDENIEFDISKIVVGTTNMRKILNSDRVVTEIFNFHDEGILREINNLYYDDNVPFLYDSFLKDFSNIFKFAFDGEENNDKDVIKSLIYSLRLEIGDIEGQGYNKGEIVFVKDSENNFLYKDM